MEALRTIVNADVLKPIIDLPWKSNGMEVEVIVIPHVKKTIQRREVSVESLKGCLKAYVKPELQGLDWEQIREKEKGAWVNNIMEKYGC
jgi:hypothetical protein